MLKKILTIGGPAVVAFAVGSFGGYLFARKLTEQRLGLEFDARLAAELEETKAYYKKLETIRTLAVAKEPVEEEHVKNETGEVVIPSSAVKPSIEEVVNSLKYHTLPPKSSSKPTVETRNVFKSEARGYDIPDDPERSDKAPYIISADEFMDGEVGYPQTQLLYYTENEALVDISGGTEELVDAVNTLVGVRNLSCFGNKSNDPDVVYIRNERVGNDFEITRVFKSYVEEVAGLGGDDG